MNTTHCYTSIGTLQHLQLNIYFPNSLYAINDKFIPSSMENFMWKWMAQYLTFHTMIRNQKMEQKVKNISRNCLKYLET